MAKGFFVSYSIVTPESADNGDFSEVGFIEPGGWKYPIGEHTKEGLSLREALKCIDGPFDDNGRWFESVSNYASAYSADDERRAIHPPRSITPASYKRIARILQAKII